MKIAEENIKTKRGNIAIYSIIKEESIANILFIHGLGESASKYFDFAKRIYEKNFSVYLIDLKGHGNSYGKIGDTSPRSDILEDIDAVIEYIEKSNDKNINIISHSMGANILVDYLLTNASLRVKSVVLCSPWISLKKKFNKFEKLYINLLNIFHPKFLFSRRVLDTSEITRFNHDLISARTIKDSSKIECKLNNHFDFGINVLIIQGMKDRLCLPEGSRLLASKIRGSKYIRFDSAPHNIIIFDTEKIVDWVTDWVISE